MPQSPPALTVLRGFGVQAAAHGVQLLLPHDIIVAQRFAQDAPAKVVAADAIPDGWLVSDIFHTLPILQPIRLYTALSLGGRAD